MAKKEVTDRFKIQAPGGKATPAPPIGPALGGYGINMMEFIKGYNERTKDMIGSIVPVEITIFDDRSFTFITKTPPAARMILKAAGVEKGSPTPQKLKVASITPAQVREIATTKMADLNANDLEAAAKIIEGTARQMGITVSD